MTVLAIRHFRESFQIVQSNRSSSKGLVDTSSPTCRAILRCLQARHRYELFVLLLPLSLQTIVEKTFWSILCLQNLQMLQLNCQCPEVVESGISAYMRTDFVCTCLL